MESRCMCVTTLHACDSTQKFFPPVEFGACWNVTWLESDIWEVWEYLCVIAFLLPLEDWTGGFWI